MLPGALSRQAGSLLMTSYGWILANECPRATSQKTLPLKHYFFSLELGHLELLPLQMKQNKIKRFIVATQKGFLSANWIGINTYIRTHTTTLLWMQVLANYTHM